MTVFDMEIGIMNGMTIIATPFIRPSGLGIATQYRSVPKVLTARLNKLTKALHDADSRLVGPVALSENGTHGAKCFIWRSE